MDTPHPEAGKLYSGHSRCAANYAVERRHGTKDWLLIYTVSGAGRFGWRPGGEIVTTGGDVTVLAAGAPHDYRTCPGSRQWEILWAHFVPRAGWRELLEWPQAASGLCHLALAGRPEVMETVARRLADTHRLNSGALARHESLGMNALEEALLWCDTVNPRSLQAGYDPRVRRALDLLCAELDRPFHLPALAARVGLSESRFAHLFRAQVGRTPGQFLEERRLDRARELLRFTPATVTEVAAQVGFASAFYFSARFRRAVGVSPRRYREG